MLKSFVERLNGRVLREPQDVAEGKCAAIS